MQRRLYALDWNPNGTNDLIVTDEDCQVLDLLPEALFGVNVDKGQIGGGLLVTDGEEVWYDCTSPEVLFPACTVVREVTLTEALRQAAVSPCDDGDMVGAFLERHGLGLPPGPRLRLVGSAQ